MKIRRGSDEYQNPVRRFYLVAEVTFSNAGECNGEENYYDDSELRDLIEGWADAALDDRDDGPKVRFRSLPEILVVDVDSVFRGDYPNHTDGDET